MLLYAYDPRAPITRPRGIGCGRVSSGRPVRLALITLLGVRGIATGSPRLHPPAVAAGRFLAWCGARGLELRAIAPLHVAAYIRTHPGSVPTVKQHLAAIRMLGDWLVVSQVLPVNPAAAVRGPKHVVTKGATPVLSPAEARRLLEAIDPGTLTGRRDRALVSVMLYSFARVSAVIGMRRQDYFRQERQGWLRLHEKGGTRHDVPAHHRAAEALDDYLARAGLDAATAALFQSVDPAGRRLTGRTLSRRLVLAMIKRRAAAADLGKVVRHCGGWAHGPISSVPLLLPASCSFF